MQKAIKEDTVQAPPPGSVLHFVFLCIIILDVQTVCKFYYGAVLHLRLSVYMQKGEA